MPARQVSDWTSLWITRIADSADSTVIRVQRSTGPRAAAIWGYWVDIDLVHWIQQYQHGLPCAEYSFVHMVQF